MSEAHWEVVLTTSREKPGRVEASVLPWDRTHPPMHPTSYPTANWKLCTSPSGDPVSPV